jgi:hypothetical protein
VTHLLDGFAPEQFYLLIRGISRSVRRETNAVGKMLGPQRGRSVGERDTGVPWRDPLRSEACLCQVACREGCLRAQGRPRGAWGGSVVALVVGSGND